MLGWIRRYLGIKIFISYLSIILVGIVVLLTASEFSVPSAFERHMAAMESMMSTNMGGVTLNTDLFTNFRLAVTEALVLGMVASTAAAVLVSWFVSRQVVAPVRSMMQVSQRIAEGHYDERVSVKGGVDILDMDELGQLALSFNRMAATLEKTESMRRQLIGDVTHELRTPLTTIKGYMEGLIDGVLPADPETYQSVYREADRLSHLVDDLQELSRVEAGAFSLNRKIVSVNDLVSTLIARLRHQFEEKGVDLNVRIPVSLPAVSVDEASGVARCFWR